MCERDIVFVSGGGSKRQCMCVREMNKVCERGIFCVRENAYGREKDRLRERESLCEL